MNPKLKRRIILPLTKCACTIVPMYHVPGVVDLLDEGVVFLPERHAGP